MPLRRPTRPRRSGVRSVSVAFAVTALSVMVMPGAAHADVTNAPARTWGVNGRVSVMLPVNGRIYLGGSFTTLVDTSGVSYPAKNLAVIDASTGAADLGFAASTDTTAGTEVLALATDGTRLFVGGLFKSMDGRPRSNLAALDLQTGALDPGWTEANTPSASASVDTLSVLGPDLYVGGLFSSVRNTSTQYSQSFLAKLDPATGSVDTSWTVRPDARVRAMTPTRDDTGRLFVAGDFTTVTDSAGTATSRRVAVVDPSGTGAVGRGFLPGFTNATSYASVIDVTADATQVYVAAAGSGGACTAFNATTGARVWSDHSDGDMQSVRLLNGTLYCGGHYGGSTAFADPAGQQYARQKLTGVNPADGTVTALAPQVNSPLGVWSLAADASHLYVGGDFTAISGVPQPHFAVFATTQTVATAPTLHAQPGDSVVHLSWTAPSTDGGSGVTKYKVYRRLATGSYGSAPLVTLANSVRSYDDAAGTNGTDYVYKVVALNGLGAGPASSEQAGTPQAGLVAQPPGAPVGLTATNPKGYDQLTWNPPVDNGGAPVSGYQIFRGTAAGGETLQATTTSLTYQDRDIDAGTTYYYIVTAVNGAGEGPSSNEDYTTAQPGVPDSPTLTGSADYRVVHLSWTTPADGGVPITKYVIIRNNVRVKLLSDPTATGWDDTGVTSGTSYTYQVRAVNSQGNGPYSNRYTGTPG